MRPNTNSEGENKEGKKKADVGVLQDRVDHFDHISTDDGRVLEGVSQYNERDEDIALNQTQTRQSHGEDYNAGFVNFE